MSKTPDYARISITLPKEVLAEADRLAGELGRSRSWVMAEAMRRYGDQESPGGYATGPTRRAVVREPSPAPYGAAEAAEVAAGRTQLLRSNLLLPPADRLRQAQDLVHLSRLVHPRRPRDRIIAFNRLEEYLSWKKTDRVAG